MPPRRYYSSRTGTNPNAQRFDLATLRQMFLVTYRRFDHQGYFDRWLGKDCVDGPREAGPESDTAAQVLLSTRKAALWPIEDNIARYSEADVFDMIEFLFDQVAAGTESYYHSFANCGEHFTEFDVNLGQKHWREAVNAFLHDYADGFELSDSGEVLRLGPPEFRGLLTAPLPGADPSAVSDIVEAAVTKFRTRSSSLDDRRAAVRELAGVLEYLRPELKNVLTKKDESDLFHIANNFGVRHHNKQQKNDYDPDIWLNWMFYFYLATIHAAQRMIQRTRRKKP